jgi:hypothetical protein
LDLEGRPAGVATRRQRTAARHAQAFLGAVLVAFVFGLTRRAFGRGPAIVAGLAAATYRPLLLLPSLLLKPNLFLPVMLGLLLAFLAASDSKIGLRRALARWFGVGLLGGAAALLRGNALILLPLLLLAPIALERSRRGLLHSCALVFGLLVLLLPVTLRNQAVGGVFALSTSGAGTNVYGGNAVENPYGLATEFPWVRGVPEHEAEDWRREAERRTGRSLDAGEVSNFWLGELGTSIAEDPLGHGLRLWRKLRLSLGAYEVPDNHDIEWDARYLTSLALPFPGWGLWGTLGLAGFLRFVLGLVLGQRPRSGGLRSARGFAAKLLVVAFLAYLTTILLTVTSARIRLMLVPLLLPFAGWMVFQIGDLVRPGRSREEARPMLLGGSLICALLFAFVPGLPADVRGQKLDGRDMNHVRILLEGADRLDEAELLVATLVDKYPGDPRLATLEAEVRFRRAGVFLAEDPPRLEEAGMELSRAMSRLGPVAQNSEADPKDRFRARLLAGLCQLRAGSNPGAARRHLEQALTWDPSDRVARLGLANALAMMASDADMAGRGEEAASHRDGALELLRGLREERDELALELRESELQGDR